MDEFADRLNALFAAFLQPATGRGRRREEWTNSHVARLAADLGAVGEKPILTRQYLSMLRSGERTQPSLRAANSIALAFTELARRDGAQCEPAAVLSYLAGEHPPTADRAPDGRDVRDLLTRPDGDHDGTVPVSARLGDESDPGSLRDIEALIDRLSQQDAESTRRRLARLLRIRPPGTDS